MCVCVSLCFWLSFLKVKMSSSSSPSLPSLSSASVHPCLRVVYESVMELHAILSVFNDDPRHLDMRTVSKRMETAFDIRLATLSWKDLPRNPDPLKQQFTAAWLFESTPINKKIIKGVPWVLKGMNETEKEEIKEKAKRCQELADKIDTGMSDLYKNVFNDTIKELIKTQVAESKEERDVFIQQVPRGKRKEIETKDVTAASIEESLKSL